MKERYKLFRRGGGVFYLRDTETLAKLSLRTRDRVEANRLLAAKNQSVEQPSLNRSMAKVYLSASSPKFASRTWGDVIDRYAASGSPSSQLRKARVFRSRPYLAMRRLKLIDTEAEHLLTVMEHKQAGNSTIHYTRRLHNHALYLGWLVSPVMAEAAWPKVKSKKFTAITREEHERIIASEQNIERRRYYCMLWETGGSQSDVAGLSWDHIDRIAGVIRFQRQKLATRGTGGMSCLRIGPRIQALLDQCPQEGPLFPRISLEGPNHRTTEFSRRCRVAKIVGRSLHSYRYAWAQRACAAGMPEREAMNHLGHKSRAVHLAYAADAISSSLPLEAYEAEAERKILQFKQQGLSAPAVATELAAG
jgi:integrase